MISKLDINIIDTHSFKTLGIMDTSIYNPDIAIEEVTIEITPPGYKIPSQPYFKEKGLNIYNSNSVGITRASCQEELVDLPDGLWKIKYSICPNDKLYIEKIFLKTDKIQCKFDQSFLNLDLSSCDTEIERNKLKQLQDIEVYIQGAVSACNKKDYKLSLDLYKKADKLLNSFIEFNGQCAC